MTQIKTRDSCLCVSRTLVTSMELWHRKQLCFGLLTLQSRWHPFKSLCFLFGFHDDDAVMFPAHWTLSRWCDTSAAE